MQDLNLHVKGTPSLEGRIPFTTEAADARGSLSQVLLQTMYGHTAPSIKCTHPACESHSSDLKHSGKPHPGARQPWWQHIHSPGRRWPRPWQLASWGQRRGAVVLQDAATSIHGGGRDILTRPAPWHDFGGWSCPQRLPAVSSSEIMWAPNIV